MKFRAATVAFSLASAFACTAAAADFCAILFDLSTSKVESAEMEMSSNAVGTVTFFVYPGGASQSSASTTFNADYYASSANTSLPNLFSPSGGASAMVCSSSVVGASAFVRQWSFGHNVGFSVPSTTVSLGNSFKLPGSSAVSNPKVLVGNPSIYSEYVYLYYGTSSSPASVAVVGGKGFAILNITQTNKAVRVTSTRPSFVQLAVELEGEYDMSFVLPD